MKILGREPTLWITTIASVLSLIAGFGADWLTAGQAAAVVVALNAILGIVNAVAVRPVAPAAFTYATGAIAALVGAYGVHVSQSTVGLINAAAISVLALLLRGNVSPASDPVPPESLRAR